MKQLKFRPPLSLAAVVTATLVAALPLSMIQAQDTSRPRVTLGWGNKTPTPTPTPASGTYGSSATKYVYANASSVVLRSGVSPTSSIVGTAAKGEKLLVLEEVGQRLKIKTTNGTTGYVVRLNTSMAPPVQGDGGFGGLLRDNRGAGEQSSGGSVRGLRPRRAPIGTTGTLNLEVPSLDNVRSLAESIKEDEVVYFMASGEVTPP